MNQILRQNQPVGIFSILMLFLVSLACQVPNERGDGLVPTETPVLIPNESRQSLLLGDLTNEDGSPELILDFSAENMMDLPVYRASLSNAFIVSKTGPGPWVVEHISSRSDDLLNLGGVQPGTVLQESVFHGSYDLKAGTLIGTLTHEYSAHQLATEDHLESQATSMLACELSLARNIGTNTLQGNCIGSLNFQYVVPGYPDYNQQTERGITLLVSTELPESLLDQQ